MKKPLTSRPIAVPLRFSHFTANQLLVVGAVGVLLYVAHAAFIPIALALLFALVLSGPVEALYKLKVPRGVGASVMLVMVLCIGVGIGDAMWTPCQNWYLGAPQTIKLLQRKLVPVAKFLSHVEELRSRATTVGATAPTASPGPLAPAASEHMNAPLAFMDVTRGILVSVVSVFILTLFLLAGGPPMLARMTAAFVSDLNAAHVLHIIEKVRAEVGRFYVTTALINTGLGFATGVAMYFCGMPTPYLWGVVAGVLNFVPYAGPITTLIFLILVAAVTFNTFNPIAAVVGCYLLLTFIEGQLVQPMLVGRRLELNPLLIFLALWLGGFYWGIAGVILATPALVAFKVIAENAINGKPLMDFLGPNHSSPARRVLRGGLQRMVGGRA
jgi:predicted PurR-regulated permease PerM